MYGLIYRVVLRRLPAEGAHRAGFWAIRAAAGVPGGAWALRRWLGPRDPVLRVRALGLEFPGPVGLAAGFDKDARGVAGLGALGFGFVEVGTVTARAQPGNPRPRLFRLTADRALVNRMGFNNEGAAAAAARLSRLRRGRVRADGAAAGGVRADRSPAGGVRAGRGGGGVIVGVNIGKTKAVPEEGAAADYAASARAVAGVADYVVVNVSSPNTPGLRDLQAVGRLRPVLVAVREALDAGAEHRVPLLVKIAPDLADADVDAVADLALELGLDGIVATNTTVSRDGLASSPGEVAAAEPAGCPGRRCGSGRLRCCGGCTPAPAGGWCSSRSAGSRARMTRGSGCGRARRWCRRTPGSSTGGRCGRGGCTTGWRGGRGRRGWRPSARRLGGSRARG